VAGWLYREWWRDLGDTPHAAEQRLRRRLERDRLPLALVALAGAEPVGTASIVTDDHPYEPASVPYLSGLYVCPDWRRKGVGAALCRQTIIEARRLEFSRLFLLTKDSESFYRRLGWQKISDTVVGTGRGFDLTAFMQWPVADPENTAEASLFRPEKSETGYWTACCKRSIS
jgi:predicted N-acetyltransferase YhbS